ncbi:hypothetical protein AA106556_2101 [Neokomagataea tanensis NBRC 106556]|uniref:Uncharacterized protein n=2 Tax=Acetobacteraceae TaxID=433 RepID=A0ABQ0QLR0_9PROT|nr:hypothetical protein AA106556_2101 [Neokomagataea tanensis NBRC 106556]
MAPVMNETSSHSMAIERLRTIAEEMDLALKKHGIAGPNDALWEWSRLLRMGMDVYSHLVQDNLQGVTQEAQKMHATMEKMAGQAEYFLTELSKRGESELQTAKAELEDARMSYHRAKEMSEHRQREITHEILSDLNVSLKRDVKEYIGRWLPIHATEYAKSVVYRAMAIVVASTLSFTMVCTGLCWWALHDKASVGSYCQAHMYQGLNGKEIYCLLPNVSPIVREK